jgi:hypothetical protein
MMTSTENQKLSPSTDSLFYPLTPPMETFQVQMPDNFFFAYDSTNSLQPYAFDAPQPHFDGDYLTASMTGKQWRYEDLVMPPMESACPPTTFIAETPALTACKPSKKQRTQNNAGTHFCNKCPAKFVSKYHLKRHDKKHTEGEKFGCSVPGCRTTSHRSDNMAKHIDTHQKRLAKQTAQRANFMATEVSKSVLVNDVFSSLLMAVEPETPNAIFNDVMTDYYF